MADDIQHISDTALWIAGYRALETERPDAVFRDSLAKKLAGDRGREMVVTTPNTGLMAFAMTVRTIAIDRLVEMAVAGTRKALIITEGVISYLTSDQAMQLSKDLFAVPSFIYWIHDYRRGRLRKEHMKILKEKLKHTPLRFDVTEPLHFFGQQGWKIVENIYLDEGERVGRRPPVRFPMNILLYLFPKKIRKVFNKTYGYVMYGRE
ncbi:MAG TPA: class I SAM-dependent methyltransferase [Chitinophagaceae bacterium]|jgi:O-methyltransferase involved in polyketide biosynthesis